MREHVATVRSAGVAVVALTVAQTAVLDDLEDASAVNTEVRGAGLVVIAVTVDLTATQDRDELAGAVVVADILGAGLVVIAVTVDLTATQDRDELAGAVVVASVRGTGVVVVAVAVVETGHAPLLLATEQLCTTPVVVKLTNAFARVTVDLIGLDGAGKFVLRAKLVFLVPAFKIRPAHVLRARVAIRAITLVHATAVHLLMNTTWAFETRVVSARIVIVAIRESTLAPLEWNADILCAHLSGIITPTILGEVLTVAVGVAKILSTDDIVVARHQVVEAFPIGVAHVSRARVVVIALTVIVTINFRVDAADVIHATVDCSRVPIVAVEWKKLTYPRDALCLDAQVTTIVADVDVGLCVVATYLRIAQVRRTGVVVIAV